MRQDTSTPNIAYVLCTEHDISRQLHVYGFTDVGVYKIYTIIRAVSADAIQTSYFHKRDAEPALTRRLRGGPEFNSVVDCIKLTLVIAERERIIGADTVAIRDDSAE
jgi:hypothetical protein